MEEMKPNMNMEMLPIQLFCLLYGSFREPNLLPIISAKPARRGVTGVKMPEAICYDVGSNREGMVFGFVPRSYIQKSKNDSC